MIKEHPWLKTYPDHPKWDMDIPNGTVIDSFDQTVASRPNAIGMDFMGKPYTWAELGAAANKFAAALQQRGVKKGTKIGLFLPNCPYFLIAYYGTLKIGATVVNYNPLYAKAELAHQIEDSETDIMVTLDLKMMTDKAQTMLTDTRLNTIILCPFTDILPFPKNILFPIVKRKDLAKLEPNKRILAYNDFIDNDGTYTPAKITPETDLAVLQYTGGTTGVPKGAMLSHRNIYANAYQALVNFPETDEPASMLSILPFFHVFAMTLCMNMAVMAGMTILTIPRFDLKDALKIIHKKRPHYMPAVPAIFSAINNFKQLKKYDLSSLTFCISGGAPLPVEVKTKFEAKTGCTVVEGYGLTETSPVATVNPPTGENIAGSIGLPLPQTIIEIISTEDQSTPMPIGERGEVCIQGPQVMMGYYNNAEATANTIKNGRLHTGDIGIMKENGYTYIVDRIKDMIITNGYNVYPRNIEEAIYQHPSVEECIVAGLPDKQRGEIVKAWIKLKDNRTLTPEDLKTFLKERISPMEIPKRIEFRTEPLPKTMIGKLSRKDIVAEELEK